MWLFESHSDYSQNRIAYEMMTKDSNLATLITKTSIIKYVSKIFDVALLVLSNHFKNLYVN